MNPVSVPGMGRDLAALQKRVADLERSLCQFYPTTILAKGSTGKQERFTVIARRAGLGEVPPGNGAFFRLYQQASDTFLQGGYVGAGEGGSSVADIKVLTTSGEDTTPYAASAGDRLWLEVVTSAILDEDEDVQLPGIEIDSVTEHRGGTPPANSFPSVSAAGKVVIELGRWTTDSFLPATSGNILVSGCIGSYSITRN